MDRGAWRATIHGVVKEWDMTEQLTLLLFTHALKHIISYKNYFLSSYEEYM